MSGCLLLVSVEIDNQRKPECIDLILRKSIEVRLRLQVVESCPILLPLMAWMQISRNALTHVILDLIRPQKITLEAYTRNHNIGQLGCFQTVWQGRKSSYWTCHFIQDYAIAWYLSGNKSSFLKALVNSALHQYTLCVIPFHIDNLCRTKFQA